MSLQRRRRVGDGLTLPPASFLRWLPPGMFRSPQVHRSEPRRLPDEVSGEASVPGSAPAVAPHARYERTCRTIDFVGLLAVVVLAAVYSADGNIV